MLFQYLLVLKKYNYPWTITPRTIAPLPPEMPPAQVPPAELPPGNVFMAALILEH